MDSGHSCWKRRDLPVRCHYLCIRPTIKFFMCLLRAQTVNTYNVRTASLAEGIPEAIEQSITLLMRLIWRAYFTSPPFSWISRIRSKLEIRGIVVPFILKAKQPCQSLSLFWHALILVRTRPWHLWICLSELLHLAPSVSDFAIAYGSSFLLVTSHYL